MHYNTAGRLVEYSKENIKGICSSMAGLTTDVDARDANKWIWGYKYNHAGVREQKRMLTSPHGDGAYGTGEEAKIFAHLWEYYMTGAFGEEIVQYKGFQTSADVGIDAGRRVYLGAYRYRAGGELLIHPDGTKEVNFTDNNGSVRLVVHSDGSKQHFDYKPFGDTLWTSSGSMNRDNFDGSTYDSESDLQMLGFRMYDNETGRFTTPDLLWSAFPAQTPYHYAYNSPLTYRDPTGLAPEKEKEGEELQGLEINWEYIYAIWDAINYENDRRTNQGMTKADGSPMVNEIEESRGYGSTRYKGKGNRTAEASSCYNGMDAMGNTSYTMNIHYSDNDFVNFNINFNVEDNITPEEQEKYVEQHVADTNKILEADVSFFDGFLYGTFDIDIRPGQKIADIYNSKNPESPASGILLGLRSTESKGYDKFYLSTEGLSNNSNFVYYTEVRDYGLSTESLSSWEIWGHELGHAIGGNYHGSAYSFILNFVGREMDAISYVNSLRSYYGKYHEIYKKK
jgi:RHS repeat-associated protein